MKIFNSDNTEYASHIIHTYKMNEKRKNQSEPKSNERNKFVICVVGAFLFQTHSKRIKIKNKKEEA